MRKRDQSCALLPHPHARRAQSVDSIRPAASLCVLEMRAEKSFSQNLLVPLERRLRSHKVDIGEESTPSLRLSISGSLCIAKRDRVYRGSGKGLLEGGRFSEGGRIQQGGGRVTRGCIDVVSYLRPSLARRESKCFA